MQRSHNGSFIPKSKPTVFSFVGFESLYYSLVHPFYCNIAATLTDGFVVMHCGLKMKVLEDSSLWLFDPQDKNLEIYIESDWNPTDTMIYLILIHWIQAMAKGYCYSAIEVCQLSDHQKFMFMHFKRIPWQYSGKRKSVAVLTFLLMEEIKLHLFTTDAYSSCNCACLVD